MARPRPLPHPARQGLAAETGSYPGASAPRCEDVPVQLHLIAEGERERWIHWFGDHKLESVQWVHKGLLMESSGAVRLAFRLVVEPPALWLEAGAWFLGLPLPR